MDLQTGSSSQSSSLVSSTATSPPNGAPTAQQQSSSPLQRAAGPGSGSVAVSHSELSSSVGGGVVSDDIGDPFADCSGGEVQQHAEEDAAAHPMQHNSTLLPALMGADGPHTHDEAICEVELLILEVGGQLGRKEADLRPYIDNIVKDNWLETYDALENLDDEEWRDLGLPKRLGMMLREAIARRTAAVPNTTHAPHASKKGLSVPLPVHAPSVSSPAIPTVTSPMGGCGGEQSQSMTEFHFATDEDTNTANDEDFNASPIVADVPAKTAAQLRLEVENFIIEVGEDLGRTPEDMADVIDKIINVNWVDSMERLADLTETAWQKLQLPIFFVETARQKLMLLPAGTDKHHQGAATNCSSPDEVQTLSPPSGQQRKGVNYWDSEPQNRAILPADVSQQPNSDESISLSEWEQQLAAATGHKQIKSLFTKLGMEFNRSEEEMHTLADKLIQKFNIETVAELSLISPTAYADMGVPLRLQNSLRNLVESHGQLQMYGRGAAAPAAAARDTSSARHAPIKYYSYPECPLPNKEITVEDFLERVGRNMGKDDLHMVPYVTRIVQDHWYDSVAALRKLTDSEWKELQLPRRLLDEIRLSLSDPEALDLSTVFPNHPDPAYFVCDVDLAVRRIEKEIPPNILRDTVRSLVKLMETILSRPHDRMKRRIRKANPNFHKRAGRHPSAILLLQSVGYQDVGDYWILSVAYTARLTEAHEALTKLAMSEYKKGRR